MSMFLCDFIHRELFLKLTVIFEEYSKNWKLENVTKGGSVTGSDRTVVLTHKRKPTDVLNQ
jgi:hypothetical protein